jgi:AhpC/TSA family
LRAPVDTIAAPLFPTHLPWVNATGPQSTIQRGRPLLVEFWDFCRPNSMRTLPYVKAWHASYASDGLRVVGVHCPGFDPARNEAKVRAAVERLQVAYPVLIDNDFEVWREYGNRGWPARFLFDGRGRLFHYHYGEGAYRETELEIQELLGTHREPLAPVRAEDADGAALAPQTEDQPGAYSGPYEAGGVWVVLDLERSPGVLTCNGVEHDVAHAGAYQVIEHERHTEGVLELQVSDGVSCLATCFTPGTA